MLKPLSWATNLDLLVQAYEAETNVGRRTELADAYRELTGKDVEDRLAILND